jgi:hypothetical protein
MTRRVAVLLLVLAQGSAFAQTPPTMLVKRGGPPETASLAKSTDGTAPRLATSVTAARDNDALVFTFRLQDDEVVATMRRHDEPLYNEDVVEVFLAPEKLTEYFEIEVNPLGTMFDSRISSPDGVRKTMKGDVKWTCVGCTGVVSLREVVIRVPFKAITARAPRSGDRWRANFFRIDRSKVHGDEYSAWSPTLRNPADFHVAAAFGTLLFE